MHKNSGIRSHLPEKPGVSDASFLARLSLFKTVSNFRGLRWTLKIDALPFISGGPLRLKKHAFTCFIYIYTHTHSNQMHARKLHMSIAAVISVGFYKCRSIQWCR